MEDTGRTTTAGQLAHEAFDGFVAVSESVVFDQILPDALNRQTGIQLGHDRIAVKSGRGSRRQSRAGEHFGRI
jgi:hypothetical protein